MGRAENMTPAMMFLMHIAAADKLKSSIVEAGKDFHEVLQRESEDQTPMNKLKASGAEAAFGKAVEDYVEQIENACKMYRSMKALHGNLPD